MDYGIMVNQKATNNNDYISKRYFLKGKTLGVLGFGRIGQATAKVALGAGMKVIAFDPFLEKADLQLDFFDGQKVNFEIKTISKNEVLKQIEGLGKQQMEQGQKD